MGWNVDFEDYKEYLKENHREEYKRLKAQGILDEVAQSRVDSGDNQFNSLVDSLMQGKSEQDRMWAEMVAREMTNEAMFQYTPYDEETDRIDEEGEEE